MRVIVTGATGFIGSALVAKLVGRGDSVVALSRDGASAKARLGVEAVTANLEERGDWWSALRGADAVVHLAGEPLAKKRWDARQKQVIRDSRVEATRTLVEAIAATPEGERPRVLLSASGTDYYPAAGGPLDDDEVTERDPPAEGFLGRLCRDWEKEARGAEALGVRVACLRTGLVVGKGGGFAKMTTPFKLFVGGKLGNGKQWISWIHLADTVGVYATALGDARYTGAINTVADSVRNRDFSRALGKALHRPSWLRVPGFALDAMLGEFAQVVLHGRRVVPARLRELGYTFQHPDLDEALRDAVA